jgi:uroporphyrin-III C-methyltransferase
VGAGPGSPELLTLQAAESISSADIILYDALIHPDILSLGSKKCKKIFVGKRSGLNCIKQSTINKMMKDFVKLGKIVIRLKGGDPFIFGRGGEEAVFLRDNKIPFNIVPGISSGIGVATQAGIPLTHRNYSKGVLFLTGHQQNDDNSINWDLVAKLNMTLVIYMGYKKLNKIVSALIESGKDSETPIGLVEKGTTAQQRVIIGTIGSINQKIKTIQLETPIIIIIGDILNIYKYLKDYIDINPELYSDTNNFGIHQFPNISN